MKPNIILIMVDQMRGDALGINGHPNVETPNLDMMANNGYNFKSAYSAVPSCIASRAAVLTGMKQKTHGRVGYEDGVKWKYKNTLASVFSENGYHTQCVGKMHVFPERNLCGFHNVVLHDGYLHFSRNRYKSSKSQYEQVDDYLKWLKERNGSGSDIIDIGLEANSWVARPWGYEESLHPTNWVVNESIDFLRRRDPDKPFFLKMSFVRPHSPLDPPQVYYNQYINQEIQEPFIGDWCDKNDVERKGLDINAAKGVVNKRALNRARAAYYASITHIDHQIGRFLMSLGEYGELNNSIILFTSDHGDLLGDHNLFRKALPYEGSVKIPFLIYDPGKLLKSEKISEFKEVIELRDIMPTLLDIANVNIPQTVEGRSLKPLIEGKQIRWREYIHGEHSFGTDSNHYITDGKRKYIWYSQRGEEQFFDLEIDPNETKNLISNEQYIDKVDDMRRKLIYELSEREEGYSDGVHLFEGREPISTLRHLR